MTYKHHQGSEESIGLRTRGLEMGEWGNAAKGKNIKHQRKQREGWEYMTFKHPQGSAETIDQGAREEWTRGHLDLGETRKRKQDGRLEGWKDGPRTDKA